MASSKPVFDKAPEEYRLPLEVKPTHYDVTLRTDLKSLTFDGFVKIDLDILKETSKVTFNSADLVLGEVTLSSTALKTSEDFKASAALDEKMERATIEIPASLPAGSKAQLKVSFEGKLTSNMTGYYKSAWENNGSKEFYALTQFEPTDARRSFPCWDEPLLKATFAVTMISRSNTVNLSNMPIISEEVYKPGSSTAVDSLASRLSSLSIGELTDEWKVTRFETTPPMSSYIVAFANGPFEYLESSYVSPLSGKTRPLRIYATSDCIHQAQFCLDVKAKCLPLYEKVFDVEYPLPKLDTLVASDFDAGAMENWGLITGRTSAFLLDPAKADIAATKRVATVTSHEVAHMWFGNITTMSWWDNLYLNEGFATLMGEVIIIDKLFPEWKVDSEFINQHLNSALSLDAKLSSHPIEVECPDAHQINQIFDALSYSKAGSVLRMLSNFVGEEKFLKGVSIYLKNHLYANSVTKDLWDGISEASGVDVAKMMDNWVSKMGFPFITVTETKDGINVRQDRFLETGAADHKDNETIWTVPLAILTVDKDGKPVTDNTVVLDSRETFIPLDLSKPFKLNSGNKGVYRVLYTPERLEKIAEEAAKPDSIFSLNDRMGLVNDNLALAKAGLAPVTGALTLIQGLKNEQEYLVWNSASSSLATVLTTWWENQKVVDLTNSFRQAVFSPIVKRLGYEYSSSESADISLLRTEAITAAAESGDESVVKELQNRFAKFVETGDDSHIPPDLLKITYTIAVKYGGRKEYDVIKAIQEKPKTPSARMAAIRGMCYANDEALIQETWEYVMTKAKDQDWLYFFAGLSLNRETRRLLNKLFYENYEAIFAKFAGNATLKYLVQYGISGLSTEKDAKEVEAFFDGKDISRYNLVLAQSVDGIRAKAKWIENSTSDLQSWLEKWEKK